MKTEPYPLYQRISENDQTPHGTLVARISARNRLGQPRDYIVLRRPGAKAWTVTSKFAHHTIAQLAPSEPLDWSQVEMQGAHRIVGPKSA